MTLDIETVEGRRGPQVEWRPSFEVIDTLEVTPDAAVVSAGVPYLRPRLVAMTAMGMNVAFRGYWNATDRSMLYMSTLVFMHSVNIFLNWLLIYGHAGIPAMGAEGAALATTAVRWLTAIALAVFIYRSLDVKALGFVGPDDQRRARLDPPEPRHDIAGTPQRTPP